MLSAFFRIVIFILVITLAAAGFSQQPAHQAATDSSLPDAPQPSRKEIILGLPGNIVRDQARIWTSPARIRSHDLLWLAPLAAATGVSLATDRHTMASVVSHDADFNHANDNASNVMTGGLVAIPAGLLGSGLLHNNYHQQEAGILSAEAIGDAYIVQEGLKLATWRERPTQDNGRGRFFQSAAGTDSSFPSSHSVVAWSAAAVVAGEYPSAWAQVGVYSMATGVSLTRVLAQQHFPTDVLIGSATGWLIGRYVERKHRWLRKGAGDIRAAHPH